MWLFKQECVKNNSASLKMLEITVEEMKQKFGNKLVAFNEFKMVIA